MGLDRMTSWSRLLGLLLCLLRRVMLALLSLLICLVRVLLGLLCSVGGAVPLLLLRGVGKFRDLGVSLDVGNLFSRRPVRLPVSAFERDLGESCLVVETRLGNLCLTVLVSLHALRLLLGGLGLHLKHLVRTRAHRRHFRGRLGRNEQGSGVRESESLQRSLVDRLQVVELGCRRRQLHQTHDLEDAVHVRGRIRVRSRDEVVIVQSLKELLHLPRLCGGAVKSPQSLRVLPEKLFQKLKLL